MTPALAQPHSLGEIVQAARERAPFYRRLYADVPPAPALTDLPVIEQARFWEAHGRDRQEVLTGPLTGGFVFNSGGTTGAAKHSYYSDAEWYATVAMLAQSFEGAGLQDGDRVATLFASGNLYGSLLFATASLQRARPSVVQFPLGYSPHIEDAAAVIRAFDINVFAGFPTHLLRVIEHMDAEAGPKIHLDRLIYAGELFSNDQHAFLTRRFPGITVHSAGYASVDAGPIGYADAGCAPGEHRVHDGKTIVEILDDASGLPVSEPGRSGRIVFTSLTRVLMPVIRYPSGDRAEWLEPEGAPDRKFRLLGRSEEAARVGSYTVSVSDFRSLLANLPGEVKVEAFQLVVRRENMRDRLVVRVVAHGPSEHLKEASRHILTAFAARWPEIYQDAVQGILRMPEIEWAKAGELTVNARTGKLLSVVDQRAG